MARRKTQVPIANPQAVWYRKDDATKALGHVLCADFPQHHYQAWRGQDGKWRVKVGDYTHKPFSSFEALRRFVDTSEGVQHA